MKRTMANLAGRLYCDSRGATHFVSLILLTVIVGIGSVVGLVAVRDQLVQEMGDLATGLDHLDQSFSYSIVVNDELCLEAGYADPPATLEDPADQPAACLVFGDTNSEGTRPEPSGQFP